MTNGKIPPQATDLEEAIIGAILIESNAIDEVNDIITPESFYKDSHKIIYSQCLELLKANSPIDILTVTSALRDSDKLEEIGGAYYITSLTSRINSAANIRSHALIVQEKYILRGLISISTDIITNAYNNKDPFDLIDGLQIAISKLSGFQSSNIIHIREGLQELYEQIKRNYDGEIHLTGIPSGLLSLDRHTFGFQKSDLIIVGGEPSNGKTALGLTFAKSAAMLGRKAILYSYEMSSLQLSARLMAMESGISAKRMQYKKIEAAELDIVNENIQKIENIELYVDLMEDNSFEYLERSIRTVVLKYGIEFVVIDYLQLINNQISGETHEKEVAAIVNRLKGLSKILDIPIVLLSQLSRDMSNPRPTVKRLKYSGAIEAAPDVILLIWLPSEYKMMDFECLGKTYNSTGLAHLIIGKGRNIGTTEMVLKFTKETTMFEDYTEDMQGDYIF